MKTKNKKIFTLLLSVLCLSTLSFGQNTSKDRLIRIAEKQASVFKIRQSEALQKAKEKGLVVYYADPNGSTIELQSLRNGMPVYYITDNLNAAKTLSTNEVWSGGSAGLNLSGAGQILGEWDGGGVLLTHQEYSGRVVQVDGPIALHPHSTHVAGTLIAQGVNANAKGMSHAASLQAYDWNSDASEMALAGAAGLKISNHSYGYITGWYSYSGSWYWYGWIPYSETEDFGFGYYDNQSAAWDEIAYNAPGYLILKSAGNDRGEGPSAGAGHYAWINDAWTWSTTVRGKDGGTSGYDCIAYNGVAKNILTVGAVNDITSGYVQASNVVMTSFSCWGPTDDGRIKPDIVGNGSSLNSSLSTSNTSYGSYSGTSMATPNVAGSIGLLLEHKENLDGNSENWRAASMKALVLHTADEAGANPGPDYKFGWGLMNTKSAAALMTEDALQGGDFNIRELSLNDGESYQTTVYADGSNAIKATIVWTDPAGTPPTPSLDPTDLMLVNDLDMRISNAAPVEYFPYILDPANPANAATTGDNFRDNVEQILINSTTPGAAYTLTVNHKGTLTNGSQAFTLVISGITKPDKFALTGPTTVTAGSNSSNFSLQVYDVHNQAIDCHENSCFALTSNSTGQNAAFSNEAPCITADNDNTSFTYTDSKIGTYTITASCSSGEPALSGETHSIPITVNILPWLQANISTANGSTEFFPAINSGTYEMTATGLSAPRTDVHNFVYQQICGTGTVIVRLDDIANGGWAGVMMRESTAPGAKAVYIKTKLYGPGVFIGYRSSTNGNMVNISRTIPSIHWMKIQRTGNSFKIYTSYNGTSWITQYTATVSMTNCILAGFFTESSSATKTTTSWFDHAEVVNYLKSGEEMELVQNDDFNVDFYPNPANNQITILSPENNEKILVSVINASGMLVMKDQFNSDNASIQLQNLKPGVYLLRFERNGIIVNKRLIIM
ncbi:MAG: S8 family serine peptidase [Bacteroidales bacterium]